MFKSKKRINHLNICISTIVTPDFIPGTLVMLDSFLRHNKWFKGDILIYGYNLRDHDRKLLQTFPNIKFLDPDPELVYNIDKIIKERPDYRHKKMMFYSLSLFNITGYDKYIYMDSDAFFTGNIKPLMLQDHGLMCSPDFASYKGFAKNRHTFELERNPDNSESYWFNTFNSGVLIIDKKLVNREVFEGLLSHLSSENYAGLTKPSADQYLLNLYFRENYYKLPGIYNYRINISREIKHKEGKDIRHAKIIHFPGKKNPWNGVQVIKSVQKWPHSLEYFKKWNDAYLKLLKRLQKSR